MKTKQNSRLRKTLVADDVISMYLSGASAKAVAEHFCASIPTIRRLLRDNNIVRGHRDLSACLPELKEQILSYPKSTTITQICRDLHINYKIYKMALTGNTSLYTYPNDINEDLIDINNPKFCYILGLFLADGHIDETSMYISQCNASFLKKLQVTLNHKGNIRKVTNTKNPCYILKIRSPKFRRFLECNNVQSNKKTTAPYIDCGTNTKHFIRGLFDGDGNIYYAYISGKLKQRRWSITTGSASIRDGIVSFLKETGIESTVYTSTDKNLCYSVFVDKINDINNLFHILYDDANECILDSKYISYMKFINLVKMNNQVNEIVGPNSKELG